MVKKPGTRPDSQTQIKMLEHDTLELKKQITGLLKLSQSVEKMGLDKLIIVAKKVEVLTSKVRTFEEQLINLNNITGMILNYLGLEVAPSTFKLVKKQQKVDDGSKK